MSEFTYLFRGREISPSPEQMQKTLEVLREEVEYEEVLLRDYVMRVGWH